MHRISGFYPILDTELAGQRGINVIAAAEAILEAGARVLQFRHKSFLSREAFEQAERIAQLCCTAGALFGIVATVDAQGHQIVYFNDDNTNAVMELTQ